MMKFRDCAYVRETMDDEISAVTEDYETATVTFQRNMRQVRK
jgi:hypothetical protein